MKACHLLGVDPWEIQTLFVKASPVCGNKSSGQDGRLSRIPTEPLVRHCQSGVVPVVVFSMKFQQFLNWNLGLKPSQGLTVWLARQGAANELEQSSRVLHRWVAYVLLPRNMVTTLHGLEE
jgi:hypothetical protein